MADYYLFGTQGCHLCEQAEQLIEQFGDPISYQKKDIAEDRKWLDKYAIRIPVLYHLNSQQELDWPFDNGVLGQFIRQHRTGLPPT